jgi:hypothetical protein
MYVLEAYIRLCYFVLSSPMICHPGHSKVQPWIAQWYSTFLDGTEKGYVFYEMFAFHFYFRNWTI